MLKYFYIQGSEQGSNCNFPLYSPSPHNENNDNDDSMLVDDNITLPTDEQRVLIYQRVNGNSNI